MNKNTGVKSISLQPTIAMENGENAEAQPTCRVFGKAQAAATAELALQIVDHEIVIAGASQSIKRVMDPAFSGEVSHHAFTP